MNLFSVPRRCHLILLCLIYFKVVAATSKMSVLWVDSNSTFTPPSATNCTINQRCNLPWLLSTGLSKSYIHNVTINLWDGIYVFNESLSVSNVSIVFYPEGSALGDHTFQLDQGVVLSFINGSFEFNSFDINGGQLCIVDSIETDYILFNMIGTSTVAIKSLIKTWAKGYSTMENFEDLAMFRLVNSSLDLSQTTFHDIKGGFGTSFIRFEGQSSLYIHDLSILSSSFDRFFEFADQTSRTSTKITIDKLSMIDCQLGYSTTITPDLDATLSGVLTMTNSKFTNSAGTFRLTSLDLNGVSLTNSPIRWISTSMSITSSEYHHTTFPTPAVPVGAIFSVWDSDPPNGPAKDRLISFNNVTFTTIEADQLLYVPPKGSEASTLVVQNSIKFDKSRVKSFKTFGSLFNITSNWNVTVSNSFITDNTISP